MENDRSTKIKGSSNSKRKKCKHRKRSEESSDDASVIIINDDKVPLPIVEKCHKLEQGERNERQVQLGLDCGGIRDLKITQNFEIKQNKNEYVINIDTNIIQNYSDAITLRRNTSNKTLFRCYPPKERIIPKCERKKCKYSHRQEKHSNEYIVDKSFSPNHYKDITEKSSDTSLHKHKRCRKHKQSQTISSIPSIPMSELHESISSDSFESCMDLDSLIKRTKQREKKMSHKNLLEAQSYTPPVDNTPSVHSTDMNASIHSMATVVLDPIDNSAYSPISSCGYRSDNYIEMKDHSINEELYKTDDLELKNTNMSQISKPFNTCKQLKLEITKMKIEKTDDYMFDAASIKQIKEEYLDDDMFLNDYNDDEDYILWDDDGLIEDVAVKEEL